MWNHPLEQNLPTSLLKKTVLPPIASNYHQLRIRAHNSSCPLSRMLASWISRRHCIGNHSYCILISTDILLCPEETASLKSPLPSGSYVSLRYLLWRSLSFAEGGVDIPVWLNTSPILLLSTLIMCELLCLLLPTHCTEKLLWWYRNFLRFPYAVK